MPSYVFELKITNIFKSSEWTLEKSELPWEHNYFIAVGVSSRTFRLPSFNGLLQIGQDRSIYIFDIILG